MAIFTKTLDKFALMWVSEALESAAADTFGDFRLQVECFATSNSSIKSLCVCMLGNRALCLMPLYIMYCVTSFWEFISSRTQSGCKSHNVPSSRAHFPPANVSSAHQHTGGGGRWIARQIIRLTLHVFAGRYFLFNVFIVTYEFLYSSH